MKRIFSLMAACLLLGGFWVLPVSAGVAGQYLDQANENSVNVGAMTIGAQETHGRAQTFKPTADKIVSVDLYLKNMVAGKELSLEIRKESDGTVVAPWTKSVPFIGQLTEGWITVAFESPFVTVTPETEYGIYLTLTGDYTTKWAYQDNNPYLRGQAKGFPADDFLFRVYGVKNAPAAAVSDSIKAPVLTSVEKNGNSKEGPVADEVTVGIDDELALSGTSFAGAKVKLYFGDKEYDATVKEDGTWTFKIRGAKLSAGNVSVKAQAITTDNKASEKTEILTVKVLGVKTSSNVEKKTWIADWNIFYVLVPVGVLLLILLLLSLIARRHHREKIGVTTEKKEVTETAEEPNEQEEPKETPQPKVIRRKRR